MLVNFDGKDSLTIFGIFQIELDREKNSDRCQFLKYRLFLEKNWIKLNKVDDSWLISMERIR